MGDIFADNEVLRVIKGSSIRDSLPPDYVNGRPSSVQPSYPLQRKRSPSTSNLGDISRAGKRQKVYRPDDLLPSRERDPSDSEEENLSPEDIPINEVIPNSQGNEVEDGSRHIKQEKPLQASRPNVHQPSPVLGEGDDEEVVVSDSQGKETSGRNITGQTRQSLQNTTEPQENIQVVAKTTPKPSNGAARRPSNKRRERSDDISDYEDHTPITPSRGISDPYSDIETDLEQPTRTLRRRGRVTPLRKSNKASPISAKPKLVQYGRTATRSKAGSSSNNSTLKPISSSAPAITPSSARTTNGDTILPGKTLQNDSASADNGGDKSDGSVDAGAKEAAQELSSLASESAKKKRVAELEQQNATFISKARQKAAANTKRQAKAARNLEAKEKKENAAKEAETAEAKAKLERENVLAEEARRQAEATKKAEVEKREEAKRQKVEEAKKQEAEEVMRREAEDAKKRKSEAAAKADAVKREEASKREKEASDKKDAEVASTRKRSTPARSPGGMFGKAVAEFDSKTASSTPGANVADMPPPPAAVRGRLSTSPAVTRKMSKDIRTAPILPPCGSSDIKVASSVEPGSATRRVSFAEPSPSVAGKTPSRATQSPVPIQTPRTVNGIQNSSANFRQSTLVPPGTGAKSVTPKVFTPSSSQAPTPGQQVKSTPTPKTRADITAALLNTINKGSCKLLSFYSITPDQWFLERIVGIAILHKLTIYSISSEGGSGLKAKCHHNFL